MGVLSCQEETTAEVSSVPEDVELIDEPTFVKVFAEAQVIESHISVLRIYQPYFKDSVNHYYKALFEKYETTGEAFYYSMQEYAKNPGLMDSLITQAIVYLKEKEVALGDVKIPNHSLNSLSRQQIGDIVFETPIKNLMLDADPVLAELLRDSLFHYLDSFPEIVTDKGYDMESVRFTFVLNTNNKMMFNQLKTYLKNKDDKAQGVD
ncbi:hypothetical protein CRYO30217_01003 [Parvicella tangerina]|uniref:DUF4296 domain-containing protein n=1 Tax=Parvicella tangerina TaxID=2829795 RepID=A0A916NAP9_9FLAO|nr:hypothetical protein CRYO30217_01003 [Parvicella tangerina]